MEQHQKMTLLFLTIISALISSSMSNYATLTKKYQIECTMCSSCNDPCAQDSPVPPPPVPVASPPPPLLQTPTTICPPPPSTGTYSPPTPGGGGGIYYYPPPNTYGPATPVPPNPNMPYTPPLYYYGPPPYKSSSVKLVLSSVGYGVGSVLVWLCLF